jgi:HEPN domain-containing protein
MSDPKHARLLLSIAGSDRKALHHMLDTDSFDDVVFGFHAQQAVEKAFKAWLSWRGIAYPRTHDLKVLYRLLEDQGEPGLEEFIGLVDLTDFAVQFRYDLITELEPIDRPTMINRVDALFDRVEQRLQYENGEASSPDSIRP